MKRFKPHEKLKWGLSIGWLLIIITAAFLLNLGGIGLMDKTEAVFVEAAREMVDSGDWITPYWNGQPRFDKPPLIYWLIGMGFKLYGMNEWTARLPSALLAISLTILGFHALLCFGKPCSENSEEDPNLPAHKRMFWKSAWIGAPALALNPAWIAWGRTGVSDMLLAGNIGMAMLCFFMGYARRGAGEEAKGKTSDRWYLFFYIFMAFAVLAKGPVGVVLPLLCIVPFLFYLGKLKQVFLETRPLRGLLVFAAIAVPWFILVTVANGQDYVNAFFGHHNIARFTSVVSNHRGQWYFYFPVIVGGLFPWSVYLPLAMGQLRFWKRRRWEKSPRSSQLGLYALFWFFSTFLFFSISITKLPSYVLPLMPAGAILVALMFGGLMRQKAVAETHKGQTALLISALFNVLFFSLLATASFFVLKFIRYDPAMPNLKETLALSGLPVLCGVLWGTGAFATLYLLIRRSRRRWLWGINTGVMMAFMILIASPAISIIDAARQLPIRQLSGMVIHVQKPGEKLIFVGPIKPSVSFYTRQTVDYFDAVNKAVAHMQKAVKTKPNSSFLLFFDRTRPSINEGLKHYDHQTLGTAGVYELVRISNFPIMSKGKRISVSSNDG